MNYEVHFKKKILFFFQPRKKTLTPEQYQQQLVAQQQAENANANNYTGFDSRVADITTGIGKAGLVATAGLGAATAYQGGQAIYNGIKAGKDAKKFIEALKKDPEQMEALKKGGTELSNSFVQKLQALGIEIPKEYQQILKQVRDKAANVGGQVIDAGKAIYNNTNFSNYDKLVRYWGYLNKAADTNRMILNSAGNWTGMVVDGVTDKLLGGALQSPEENKAMSNILSGVGHKFETEADKNNFLKKLESNLSPEEFSKIKKGMKNGIKFSEEEVKTIMSKIGPKISQKASENMKLIPKVVGRAGKALGHFKNARELAKATAGIGGAAALAYYNGKSFQDYRNNARNSNPNAVVQGQQVAAPSNPQ